MKCPGCGKEIPEDYRFCDICGTVTQRPSPAQPAIGVTVSAGRSRVRSHQKSYIAVAIVAITVLAMVGLAFTQPWARITITMFNQEARYTANVAISIDGQEMKFWGGVLPGHYGVESVYVKTGSHSLAIDLSWLLMTSLDHPWATDFDGIPNWTQTVYAYPLITKDLQLSLAFT